MPSEEESLTGITAPAISADTPQFAKAEYVNVPGTERCRICGNVVSGEYYRVNTQMACSTCALQAKDGQPKDSHVAFARGLLLGAGAALVGLALYATVVIVTDWTIGYLALAVGWLVAKAMLKGSNGIGGRRYQIAAVLLTYAAISMSSIPVLISYGMKKEQAKTHQSQPADASPSATADGQADATSDSPAPEKKLGLGAALGQLALFGLASPFLELQDPGHGVIGLFILFIGLSVAFRMTAAKPLDVDGPYGVTGG